MGGGEEFGGFGLGQYLSMGPIEGFAAEVTNCHFVESAGGIRSPGAIGCVRTGLVAGKAIGNQGGAEGYNDGAVMGMVGVGSGGLIVAGGYEGEIGL